LGAWGVCGLELATPTHWHKQTEGAELAQSRAGTDGRLTGRAYGRQLAPAGWLPHGVQKACPEPELFWKFEF